MAQGEGSFSIVQYGAAVEAFNRDNLGLLSEMLADDCVFISSVGPVGNSRDEIIANFRQGRSAGWRRHVVLSISATGDFAVSLFRNEFADGTSAVGGGVFRVNGDGKICEVRTLDPEAPPEREDLVRAIQGK